MAGKPRLDQLGRDIANLEDGEDTLFEWMADGVSVGECGKRLGVSRDMMYAWRKRDPNRRPKWEAAIEASAEALVEDGGQILETLAAKGSFSNAEVTLAAQRKAWRFEVAKMRNPEKFGDKQQSITVNIGSLHLDALRATSSPVLKAREILQIATPDEDAA